MTGCEPWFEDWQQVREVFFARDCRSGDEIAYPARLRRSETRVELKVVRVKGRYLIVHKTGTSPGNPDHEYEYVVHPLQIEENGVLVRNANSHSRGEL